MNPHREQLLVGLTAELVENCRDSAEAKAKIIPFS